MFKLYFYIFYIFIERGKFYSISNFFRLTLPRSPLPHFFQKNELCTTFKNNGSIIFRAPLDTMQLLFGTFSANNKQFTSNLRRPATYTTIRARFSKFESQSDAHLRDRVPRFLRSPWND